MDFPTKLSGPRTIRSAARSSSRECSGQSRNCGRAGLARRLFSPKRIAVLFLGLFILTVSAVAKAGEIQVDAGTTLLGSSWQGDFAGGGLLRLGYRFARVVSIDFVGWEQMAIVDERFDTGLTFGVTGFIPLKRVRPSLRIFAIHQHEEGAVSVAQTPGGFIFGIGSGIRHRAGGGLTLGAEIPLGKNKDLEWILFAELQSIWFPDALGPTFYYGGNLGIGFNYSLPKLP